jgi:tetratricopeptide (TPR) repeat protein
MMATLSVCLIVRDEERFLGNCLDSVAPVADEIVVVDTGSTDRTVEIARRYTDTVFFHPWNDDFSEARNVSLGHATGDWILQVDADEVLEQRDIPLLQRAMAGDDYVAVYVILCNRLPDGLSRHYFPRLFRRGKAHYEGIVHNQLVYDGQAIISEVRIYHDGYNLDPKAMACKYRRTETLLKRRLQSSPDDLTALAQLVRVYREWGRFDQVAEDAVSAMARCNPTTHRNAHHMLASDLGYALLQLGRLEEARQVCQDALVVHRQSLDIWYTLAGVYFRQCDYPRAVAALHHFLALHEEVQRRPPDHLLMMGTYGKKAQAWQNLGACYEALGRPNEALTAYSQACALAPKQPDYRMALGQLLLKLNRTDEAAASLRRAIALLEDHLTAHSDDAAGMTKLATCYLLLGRPEAARLGYQAALALKPAFPPARKGLALFQKQ